MNNYIFLQARMGSTRLPGKTLKDLNRLPLILHVINRLELINSCEIVLLTSDTKKDDILEKWCKENSTLCFRGSEDNVLERYYNAAKFYKANNILRATGDNPLIEPYFANELLNKHIESKADYSSNKSEVGSNLPDGLGIEIFTFEALESSMQKSTQEHHFEHVNEYILENRDKFKIYKDCNVGGLIDKSNIRLTVDTSDDFKKVEAIFKNQNFKIDINYNDLLGLVKGIYL
ncbi:MAG: glycosyltransferase family protein [Candidatus Gracilibacteria bacterium]